MGFGGDMQMRGAEIINELGDVYQYIHVAHLTFINILRCYNETFLCHCYFFVILVFFCYPKKNPSDKKLV